MLTFFKFFKIESGNVNKQRIWLKTNQKKVKVEDDVLKLEPRGLQLDD